MAAAAANNGGGREKQWQRPLPSLMRTAGGATHKEINYYIIDCLKTLDSPGEDIVIGSGMEQEIRASYQHLRTVRFLKIAHYAVNTLVFLSLILTALLQFRILYIH